ncbi:hypothetical protein [Bosea beijingensis]
MNSARSSVSKVASKAFGGRAVARFVATMIERGRFVLIVHEGGRINGSVRAFVNGIKIGESAALNDVACGERVEVLCSYFPHVPLPACVRFSDDGEEGDMAPPKMLNSLIDIELLVGSGTLQDVHLTVQNGVIAGTGVNRINGLGRPHLLGRVNGHALREVRYDAPRGHDQGGCSVSFSLPIEAADLSDSGASYEILTLPDLKTLGAVSFPRSDSSALSNAVRRVEAQLSSVTKRVDLTLARAEELSGRRARQHREMLDSTVEYVVALVYDTLFAEDGISSEVPAEQGGAILAFRRTLDSIASGKEASDRLNYAVAAPETAFYADGWHWLEHDSKGFDFRWMGLSGVVFNPKPNRVVGEVRVAIGSVYQDKVPIISALFDDEPVEILIVSSPNGAPYSARIIWGAGRKPRPVHVLRIESSFAGSPLEDEGASDARVLSIAVHSVTFFYEAAE